MYEFNVEMQTKQLIKWIQDWIHENGNDNTKVVIGISGGKDSTVCAKLLCEALGKDRVIGIMMPNGEQKDISDSIKVCEFLDIKNYMVNISKALYNLTMDILTAMNKQPRNISDSVDITSQYSTNTPARIRMTTLYGIGAMIGNCLVVNTCNLSEDVLGYSTFYGDSAGDFSLLSKLTTEEVVAIGDYLGLPYNLTHKTPSDGMCGKSDEDNLGFTYHEVNELIRNNVKGENYSKIMNKYKWNKFKTDIIRLPSYDPNLPNYFDK